MPAIRCRLSRGPQPSARHSPCREWTYPPFHTWAMPLEKTMKGGRFFSEVRTENRTSVFFETARRLVPTLRVAAEILGETEIAVMRETDQDSRGNHPGKRTRNPGSAGSGGSLFAGKSRWWLKRVGTLLKVLIWNGS